MTIFFFLTLSTHAFRIILTFLYSVSFCESLNIFLFGTRVISKSSTGHPNRSSWGVNTSVLFRFVLYSAGYGLIIFLFLLIASSLSSISCSIFSMLYAFQLVTKVFHIFVQFVFFFICSPSHSSVLNCSLKLS